MILVKHCKFPLCFRTKWTLKQCLMIVQIENKPPYIQTTKLCSLHSRHIDTFFDWLNPCFWAKIRHFVFVYFGTKWAQKQFLMIIYMQLKKKKQALLSQSVSHLVSKLASPLASHSGSQSVSHQPVEQSVIQSVSQLVSQPVRQSVIQPISQSVSQPVSHPAMLVSQSVSQQASQSVSQ